LPNDQDGSDPDEETKNEQYFSRHTRTPVKSPVRRLRKTDRRIEPLLGREGQHNIPTDVAGSRLAQREKEMTSDAAME